MRDLRRTGRIRTRLRSGKIVDATGHSLADCRILDRSAFGARIQFLTAITLPTAVLFFEDSSSRLICASVIWHRGGSAGLRWTGLASGALARAARRRLSAPFYAAR